MVEVECSPLTLPWGEERQLLLEHLQKHGGYIAATASSKLPNRDHTLTRGGNTSVPADCETVRHSLSTLLETVRSPPRLGEQGTCRKGLLQKFPIDMRLHLRRVQGPCRLNIHLGWGPSSGAQKPNMFPGHKGFLSSGPGRSKAKETRRITYGDAELGCAPHLQPASVRGSS